MFKRHFVSFANKIILWNYLKAGRSIQQVTLMLVTCISVSGLLESCVFLDNDDADCQKTGYAGATPSDGFGLAIARQKNDLMVMNEKIRS